MFSLEKKKRFIDKNTDKCARFSQISAKIASKTTPVAGRRAVISNELTWFGRIRRQNVSKSRFYRTKTNDDEHIASKKKAVDPATRGPHRRRGNAAHRLHTDDRVLLLLPYTR